MMDDETTREAKAPSLWARIRRRAWARWTIDLMLFGLVFGAVSMWQSRDLVSTGVAAPATALRGLDGELHRMGEAQPRKTLVVFWAPWCGVCKAESDNISRVRSWVGDRVDVISVVLGYEGEGRVAPGAVPSDVARYVESHEVDYPVLLGDRQTAQDYRISVFPTMYVLDEEGEVEHTVTGYTTTLGMLWRVLM